MEDIGNIVKVDKFEYVFSATVRNEAMLRVVLWELAKQEAKRKSFFIFKKDPKKIFDRMMNEASIQSLSIIDDLQKFL